MPPTAIAVWRRPVPGFVGLWFFAILAPSSSVVPLLTQTVAEHRIYLPLISVAVLLLAGAEILFRHRRSTCGVTLLGVVALGVLTARRNHD